MLRVPAEDIDRMLQGVRDWDYKPVVEEGQEQDKPGQSTGE
jgi:hypothetical protein